MKKIVFAAALSAGLLAFGDVIQPSNDTTGETDSQVIQEALDAAIPTKGTVTLGRGLFMVKTQLNVAGGVTLAGQGWTNTVIKYVGAEKNSTSRVASISDGSVLSHVAVTGGKILQQYSHGGGIQISGTGGTVSWCCITNNAVLSSYTAGGGIGIISTGSVRIDHTIVSGNSAGTVSAPYGGGGIGTRPGGKLSLEIDACLVCGNTVGASKYASRGAGICIVNKKLEDESPNDLENVTTVIRNTTIANNTSVGSGMGGGFYTSQKKTTLVNCILSDNAAGEGDANMAFFSADVESSVGAKASYCLFCNETPAFGTRSLGIKGSAGFVDAEAGDYHLASYSSAVRMGNPDNVPEKDLDGCDFAAQPSAGCYELVSDEPVVLTPPVLGEVKVKAASIEATISGVIESFGTGATACDVYLAYGLSADALGAATKVAEGATELFDCSILNLSEKTKYFYELYVTNNATPAMGGVTNGSFTTQAAALFTRRVLFTIGYTGDDASGFSGIPVLVKLSEGNPRGFTYRDCATGGHDIRFFDADGREIPFEIDTWDPNGESLIWVKAPAITQGTTFEMRYRGTPETENDPAAVWTDFTGVWHLGTIGADATQYSQGLYPNSTASEGIDAHLSAMSIAGEEGRIGKAFRVNDATGKSAGNFNEGGAWVVDAGDDSPIDSGEVFTISCWLKHKSFDVANFYNNDKVFYKRLDSDNVESPNNAYVVEMQSTTAESKLAVKPSSSKRVRDDNHIGPDLRGNWVYVQFVVNGKQAAIYENGEEIVAMKNFGDNIMVIDNNAPLVFGNNVKIADGETGANAWNGWIDEVRYVKGVARSKAWVAAEYAAMTDDAFVTAGEVEKINPPGFMLQVR